MTCSTERRWEAPSSIPSSTWTQRSQKSSWSAAVLSAMGSPSTHLGRRQQGSRWEAKRLQLLEKQKIFLLAVLRTLPVFLTQSWGRRQHPCPQSWMGHAPLTC